MSMQRLRVRECNAQSANRTGWNKNRPNFMSTFVEAYRELAARESHRARFDRWHRNAVNKVEDEIWK